MNVPAWLNSQIYRVYPPVAGMGALQWDFKVISVIWKAKWVPYLEDETATFGLRWIFHMHSAFSRSAMCNNAT